MVELKGRLISNSNVNIVGMDPVLIAQVDITNAPNASVFKGMQTTKKIIIDWLEKHRRMSKNEILYKKKNLKQGILRLDGVLTVSF